MLCFGTLVAFVVAGVKAVRYEANQWILREIEEIEHVNRLKESHASKLAAYEVEYNLLYSGGTRLYLERDGRRELYGSARAVLDGVAKRHSMRKDVREWCKTNLASDWTMLPFSENQSPEAVLWFQDANEALWFKIQWY